LGVGPTFPSGTKSFVEFPGLEFVHEVAREISLPWFAIGGIHGGNVQQVIGAGARRVAVSAAICGESVPRDAAGELLAWLRA
ncbi:MAG TPA: thiamine phosphate synthase, partial [Planctomycetaceae bacterium]|nr:thiamine phosphate synthase [Planctomycetaceae bacterium]